MKNSEDKNTNNDMENKKDIYNEEIKINNKKNSTRDFSESIKLKDLTSKNEVNNIKDNKSEIINNPDKIKIEEKIKEEENDKIYKIFKELENRIIYTSTINKYGNSITIGSFCNTIAFISFGLYKCRLLSDENTNIWSIMALFGGLGQITAGVMELIKKREFPSFLYLIYGIYCLTHYSLRVMIDRFGEYDLCIFFMAFFLLSIPTILYSINTNIIFLLETCFTSLYFFFISIGEAVNEYILIEQVAGACLAVSGLLSFYIFFSQNINSINLYRYVRTFPFNSHNKIDFIRPDEKNKVHKN